MRLAKKCKNCGTFFSAEPLELNIYCVKCKVLKFNKDDKHTKDWYFIQRIKHARGIKLDYFDLVDLDRPANNYIGYEFVCRMCGNPTPRLKSGGYSHHRRYCNNNGCSGDILFNKYNWSSISWYYGFNVKDSQKEAIRLKGKDTGIRYSGKLS